MFITLFCIDNTSIGRVDKNALPDQARLELLVGDIENIEELKDSEGAFLPIEKWSGLGFDADGHIDTIKFEKTVNFWVGASGESYTIGPEGSVDFQWVPESVTSLQFGGLGLQGTLDTAALPRCMISLEIDGNNFRGKFCQSGLPRSMRNVGISYNAFQGPIDAAEMPRSMEVFWASANAFSGSINFRALPRFLKEFSVERNALSGEIDLSRIPGGLRYFDIRRNDFGQSKVIIFATVFLRGNVCLDTRKFGSIYDTDGYECSGQIEDY